MALLADALDAHAGAVVVDFDDDVAAFVTGAQADQAFGGFALGDANVGDLDAVVDGVADGMGEGIANGFEQTLVEFGLLAFHFEADALVEAEGEIADQAGEAGEEVADGLHARLHDGFAQIGGDHIEAAAEHGEIGVGVGGLENLVAGEDQLADQIHHAVEQLDVDAQGGVGSAGGGSSRGFAAGPASRAAQKSKEQRRERVEVAAPHPVVLLRLLWAALPLRFIRGRRTLRVFVGA